MPQCLLVDFGKVISHPQTDVAVAQMAAAAGLDRAAFARQYWVHRAGYDRGATAAAYWSAVLDRQLLCGDAVLHELVELDVASWTRLDQETLDVLAQARAAGAHVALLSNAPHEIADAVSSHPAFAVFDHLFFSADLGLAKPDPAIFATVLQTMGRQPEEVTFVDDLPENVAAAAGLGLATVLFTDAEDLRRHLWP